MRFSNRLFLLFLVCKPLLMGECALSLQLDGQDLVVTADIINNQGVLTLGYAVDGQPIEPTIIGAVPVDYQPDSFIQELGFSLSLEHGITGSDTCSIMQGFFNDMVYKIKLLDTRQDFLSALQAEVVENLKKKLNAINEQILKIQGRTPKEVLELIKSITALHDKYQITKEKIDFAYTFFKGLYSGYFTTLSQMSTFAHYDKVFNEFKDLLKQELKWPHKKLTFPVPSYIVNRIHIELGDLNKRNLIGRHVITRKELNFPYLENNKNNIINTHLDTVQPFPTEKLKGKDTTVFPVDESQQAIVQFLENPTDILLESSSYIIARFKKFYVLLIKDSENPFIIKTAYPLFEFINMADLSDDDVVHIDVACNEAIKKHTFIRDFSKKELLGLINTCNIAEKVTADFYEQGELVNVGRCLEQAVLHRKALGKDAESYKNIRKLCSGITNNIYALMPPTCQAAVATT